jgi:hypothetical protein
MAQATPEVHLKRTYGLVSEVEKATQEFRIPSRQAARVAAIDDK